MIEFLKKSTFAVNDVVNKSWEILYKNYQNIIGPCISLQVLNLFCPPLSLPVFTISNIYVVLSYMFFISIQLTLFKYLLFRIAQTEADSETFSHKFIEFFRNIPQLLSDFFAWDRFKHKIQRIVLIVVILIVYYLLMYSIGELFNFYGDGYHVIVTLISLVILLILLWKNISPYLYYLISFWPTKSQLVKALICWFYFVVIYVIIVAIVAVLLFPIVYTHLIVMEDLVNYSMTISKIIALCAFIRISYFSFFIIDHDFSPFKSLRFSLAFTRGNFIMLLLLSGLTVSALVIINYFVGKDYYFLSMVLAIISTFIIIPLYFVGTAVVYRQMMNEYHGDADPDILDNII